MSMTKSWRPLVEDMTNEIGRLRANVADAPFNSDFSSRMQIVKIRTAELDTRLRAMVHEVKSEAACQREMIEALMSEFMREVRILNSSLAELRIFRAERSRANFLHVQELKKTAEEGGAE